MFSFSVEKGAELGINGVMFRNLEKFVQKTGKVGHLKMSDEVLIDVRCQLHCVRDS